MGRLRIALCQINAVVGDLAGNVERICDALRSAEADGADLAVFPELAVTGYPPEDLLLEPLFVDGAVEALGQVARRSGPCVAVVGFVERGQDLHNAAAVLSNGELHGVWRKELLPNYGVFDERRWFVPGDGATPLFSIGGVRVGVAICEDAWSPTGPVSRQAAGGAELVVVLNASPYRRGVLAERRAMLSTRAADASCAIAYVNLVGGQDELVFDGGSMLFDLHGELVAAVPQFESTIQCCDLDVERRFRKRTVEPRGRPEAEALPVSVLSVAAPSDARSELVPFVAAPLSPTEEVYGALVLATRDYVEKNRFDEVVLGVSGGIDSALVAAIAAAALGPDRVHAVAMPSRFSSSGSVDDARQLADNLGIEFRIIEIEHAHGALLELLAPSFSGRPPGLAEENLQARVRGTLLMGLSNKLGWLVLTTGNKSETAVGYSTLYGDMAGGFAVIKDVPKVLVYELCAQINKDAGSDLIPQAILDKPPSAELRPDQRDDDTLPPYEVLDPILEGYVEHDQSVADLVRAGFDEDVVRRVFDLVDRAEYKRRQAPIGPRVTHRAFGKDRRMPIANRFRASAPPLGAP